jgi:hypothetical protein
LVAAAALQGFIGFESRTAHRAFGRPLKLDRQEIVAQRLRGLLTPAR